MPVSIEQIVNQVKRVVESNKRSEIRLNSNGGNSILLVSPPDLEYKYIEMIYNIMGPETYRIIDLNKLLISYIDENRKDIEESFELLKGSVHQIFKAPEGEDGPSLFSCIMKEINDSFSQEKIPVLIHTGSLYGSDIENIHIMESEAVMKSNIPLVILYPGTNEGDKIMFLSSRPASKYRCMIVN
jgi:hypothetical protein